MEKHHLLRRDPNWHPSACNLCGQMGHQAANCTNGTINWRQIYGDDAFILRQPVYWSEIQAKRKMKQVDPDDLAKRAAEYAQAQALAQGLHWEAIMATAEELKRKDPTELIKPIPKAATEEEPLPAGWAVAHDATGRPYYWHKKTQKTTWERPTEDTPIQ